jgi:hypothetical protein
MERRLAGLNLHSGPIERRAETRTACAAGSPAPSWFLRAATRFAPCPALCVQKKVGVGVVKAAHAAGPIRGPVLKKIELCSLFSSHACCLHNGPADRGTA